MSENLVGKIVAEAQESTTLVMNEFHKFYTYNRRTSRWARKLDNCKLLLGQLPRPVLVQMLNNLRAAKSGTRFFPWCRHV